MGNKTADKKTKLEVISIIILCIFIFYEILCIVLKGLMPERQTLFLTYRLFRMDNPESFHCMKELPRSAHGNKYFQSIFFFTYKIGYGTVISEEEYEETKAQCLKGREEFTAQLLKYVYINGEPIEQSEEEQAKSREELNIYSINDTEKPRPSVADVLEGNNINFFDKISRQDVKEGNYYFLWYEADRWPSFEASICNDDTHEIIEVYFGGNPLFYRHD